MQHIILSCIVKYLRLSAFPKHKIFLSKHSHLFLFNILNQFCLLMLLSFNNVYVDMKL